MFFYSIYLLALFLFSKFTVNVIHLIYTMSLILPPIYTSLLSFYPYTFVLNNIRCPSLAIENYFKSIPDYPSTLSLKGVTEGYALKSIAVLKGDYVYANFEPSFVCAIQCSGWSSPSFNRVTDIAGKITYAGSFVGSFLNMYYESQSSN